MSKKNMTLLYGAVMGIALVLFAGEMMNPLFKMLGKEVEVS
jgi:hypothetical protein